MGARFGIDGMRARLDAKSNPRDYRISRNFGSALLGLKNFIGEHPYNVQCLSNLVYYVIWWLHLLATPRSYYFIRPDCNNFYSISSRKSNNNTTKHKNYFAFCQRKNVRLSQTWRTLAQTLKGPGLQITRNRTSRLLKQQWSIKNIWVHPSHNLQRWPWSQVKRKRKMFFRWVLSSTFNWPTLKML